MTKKAKSECNDTKDINKAVDRILADAVSRVRDRLSRQRIMVSSLDTILNI